MQPNSVCLVGRLLELSHTLAANANALATMHLCPVQQSLRFYGAVHVALVIVVVFTLVVPDT